MSIDIRGYGFMVSAVKSMFDPNAIKLAELEEKKHYLIALIGLDNFHILVSDFGEWLGYESIDLSMNIFKVFPFSGGLKIINEIGAPDPHIFNEKYFE